MKPARIANAICALMLAHGVGTPAVAQMAGADGGYRPPFMQSVDANGMSLLKPRFQVSEPKVAIGQEGQGGLFFQATRFVEPFAQQPLAEQYSWTTNNLAGKVSLSNACTYPCSPYGNNPALVTVQLGNVADHFTAPYFASHQATPVPGTPVTPSGSSLTYSQGTNEITYTAADGTRMIFEGFVSHVGQSLPFWDPNPHHEGLISRVEKPDGEVITWHYTHAHFNNLYYPRVQSVTNNLGYQIHFKYKADTATNDSQLKNFRAVDRVTAIDNSIFACAATALTCSDTGGGQAWPYLQYGPVGTTVDTVTDRLGNITRFDYLDLGYYGRKLTGARTPQSPSSNDITITWNSGSDTYTLVNSSGTWNYAYKLNTNLAPYLSVTRPDVPGYSRQITITPPTAEPFIEYSGVGYFLYDQRYMGTDTLNGQATTYHYDSLMRIDKVTRWEGDYVEYTYDARNNPTRVRSVPKPGSPLAEINVYASYPEIGVTTCSNAKTCNKPTWATVAGPASGAPSTLPRTDFTYDSGHGSILIETKPAPGGAGPFASIRPETRYTYDTTGGIVRVGTTKACRASAACGGSPDEAVVEIAYNSKRLASQVVTRAGDNTTPYTSTHSTVLKTYTPQGDIESVDGPLAGAGDKTWYYYDAMRQLRVVVNPDPDGGGPLAYGVDRTTYNAAGQPTVLEKGSVGSPGSCSAANNFCAGVVTVLAKSTIAYDNFGRKLREDTVNVSTGQADAVTQYSYDSAGRVDCVATRMNPSLFGALPGACTPTTAGQFGDDRITKTSYHPNGHPSVIQTGFGTSLARAERTISYAAPGQVASLRDANNNLTTYEYDGFNRLRRTLYPVTTLGANQSSTSDYEEFGYDPSGNRVTERRRDNVTISSTYDLLNRVVAVDRPGTELDVANIYDNFNNLVSSTQAGTSLAWAYDAASRVISQSQPNGTVVTAYDTAGRRTQLVYPGGGFTINSQYYDDGRLKALDINGSETLATFFDDQLGRRSMVCRGAGSSSTCTSAGNASTGYAYDGMSRLQTVAHSLPWIASPIYWAGLGYSPAGQIVTREQANSAFESGATPSASNTYAVNGLNQYTGVNFSYDPRGNLTYDGTKTYTYDSFNRLTSASNGAVLQYDPTGRLQSLSQGAATTRFLYDGSRLIAEYNGAGTLLRRYVHADGIDDPIVWYEQGGSPSKHILLKDERGSVVSSTDGVSAKYKRYDEYGIANGDYAGRFQYTGQTWIGEMELYYYKARFYNPRLGRFMQTDPIGTRDDVNLYSYVANDPMNKADSAGLCFWCIDANYIDANGRIVIRSPDWLRWFPGQVAYDDARTAAANGDWAMAAGHSLAVGLDGVATLMGGGSVKAGLQPVASTLKAATVARAATVAPIGQTVALGKSVGLDKFAGRAGAETFHTLKWGDGWRLEFQAFMNNGSNRAIVNLDNIAGGPLAAVQRAVIGKKFDAMDWELAQIYLNQSWWSRIDWVSGGTRVANPFQ